MANIIDRRSEPDRRYHSSRDRFLRRNSKRVREAVERAISDRSIEGIGSGSVDVTIPREDINEPFIHNGKGGVSDRVLPGNERWNAGDRIDRDEEGGGGRGGQASPNGEGDDDFVFALSEEEFLNYLYDDLALPNMTKRSAESLKETKPKRSGFVTEGPPNKLDLPRSQGIKIGRQMAAAKPLQRKMIAALEEIDAILDAYDPAPENKGKPVFEEKTQPAKKIKALAPYISERLEKFSPVLTEEDQEKLSKLNDTIKTLNRRIGLIPKWNESTDLRYRNHKQVPVPTTQAVMFCLMDVSGSMSQERKNNAKLFYMLLYRFLKRNYEKVDVVFIRHTTEADEVDEKTFFYDGKTGGTQVSTSIVKMKEVIAERYPPAMWNIFAAQASDGENYRSDNALCVQLLQDSIKDLQAYFYTEVREKNNYYNDHELWDALEGFSKKNPGKAFMGKIHERTDIWPVFRDFFKKTESYDAAPGKRSFARMAGPGG